MKANNCVLGAIVGLIQAQVLVIRDGSQTGWICLDADGGLARRLLVRTKAAMARYNNQFSEVG
jgi:hypothetical protein